MRQRNRAPLIGKGWFAETNLENLGGATLLEHTELQPRESTHVIIAQQFRYVSGDILQYCA